MVQSQRPNRSNPIPQRPAARGSAPTSTAPRRDARRRGSGLVYKNSRPRDLSRDPLASPEVILGLDLDASMEFHITSMNPCEVQGHSTGGLKNPMESARPHALVFTAHGGGGRTTLGAGRLGWSLEQICRWRPSPVGTWLLNPLLV